MTGFRLYTKQILNEEVRKAVVNVGLKFKCGCLNVVEPARKRVLVCFSKCQYQTKRTTKTLQSSLIKLHLRPFCLPERAVSADNWFSPPQ